MDDGFDWLDALPDDLQHRLWHLMDAVAEGRHGEVDGLVPGLVATAREQKRPWVEIFARNFELRSLVLHREDTRTGLGQAIALLDRAHQPDTRDCPQTICTAHAVCSAYGIKDPTGYIDERLAVSAETLTRTDPKRVCWLCISNEHADALIDAGRPDDALSYISTQRGVRLAAGAPVDPDDFGLREVGAHFAAGRIGEAHKSLESCTTDARGASWQRTWRQWKAQLLAADGRVEEAVPFLSSVADILADGGFRRHFATLPMLFGEVDDEILADDEILRQMCVLGQACLARGGGSGVEALMWATERFAEQGERTLGRAAADAAEKGFETLRKTDALDRRVKAARAKFDALPDPAPSAEGRDFETVLANLRASPGASLAGQLAHVADQFGFPQVGRAVIAEAYRADTDDEGLYQMAAGAALKAGDIAGLDALIDDPPSTEDGPSIARWFAAERAGRQGERFDAIPILEELGAQRPGWSHVAERLGALHFERGAFADADRVWSRTAALGAPSNIFHWHAMGAATAGQDWPRLRALAVEVGFPVPPGEGPINADYGLVRVVFDDDERPFYAARTGPVSARVLSLRTPGQPQRHGDSVLLHPAVINADELEADADALRVYRAVMTLDTAAFECVALDGQHPGDDAVAALREGLDAGEWFYQFAAGDDYRVVDPETGDDHPGIYLLVGAEKGDLPQIEALFAAIDAPGARVWTALLELTGKPEDAAAQLAIAEAWQMV